MSIGPKSYGRALAPAVQQQRLEHSEDMSVSLHTESVCLPLPTTHVQTAVDRQVLSCTYLAHHELESNFQLSLLLYVL